MDPNDLVVTFTAGTERYSEDDDRWQQQVAELHRQLREETGAGLRPKASQPGMKGTVDELIMALGSAGAFTTTVELLRAWLARDKTRSVEASWVDENGVQRRVTMSAQGAGKDTLAPLVQALAGMFGKVGTAGTPS